MNKEKVLEWLDKQVEANNTINEVLSENTRRLDKPTSKEIDGEYIQTIHMDSITELTEVLGIKPIENKRDDEDYPLERYFLYKGYVVFELIQKEDL